MSLSRRDLFALAAGGVASVSLCGHAFAADRPAPMRLVVLILRGGVDMLNAVVPWGDPGYAAARPTLALKRPGAEGGVIDLDGTFGLHPALASLLPLWRDRRLAFVQACGSPDPTRSHFDAQKHFESGRPGLVSASDGWMNRLLQVLPGATAPTRAISVGAARPLILTGAAPNTNFPLAGDPTKPQAIDRPNVAAAFGRLYEGRGEMGAAFRQGVDARRELTAELGPEDPTASAGAPPAAGFPQIAARLARLLKGDANIQFAALDLGGWDTHVNQGAATGALAKHLQPLGDGLAAFAQTLGGELDRTLVVVATEFGRTVRENGGGGTDHGHGTALWLLGGRVAGGKIHGRWPGLETSALHEGRDLAVTTDVRAVLAQALERRFGLSDKQLATVFPNAPRGEAGALRLF